MKIWINEINGAAQHSVAVDDMLLVKDVPATAGSKMLERFVPLFDAEAVERVKKAGFPIAGKTNVGEFGLDLLGETSAFGAVTDENGNLSSASAQAVLQGQAAAALNVDLNGAPRRAAALAGIAFLKPTYGTVSRYGVIPCACSGEQVGVTARCAADVAKMMNVIAGHDSKDGTSLPAEQYEYSTAVEMKNLRVCIPDEYLKAASEDVQKQVGRAAKLFADAGAVVEHVSFQEAKAAQQAWQILMSAETCNNLSRYDGVKFGYRSENAEDIDALYINSRTESMGFLTKATILYGSDVLSKGRYETCYDQSLRVRRIVRETLDNLFQYYDVILLPACSKTSFAAGMQDELRAVYEESFFTAVPSLTGIPAMAACGVQLMADSMKDSLLIAAADFLEQEGASK